MVIQLQSRLGAFEDEEFEKPSIIVHRDAPFFIVIGDGRFSRSPGTTRHFTNMPRTQAILERKFEPRAILRPNPSRTTRPHRS